MKFIIFLESEIYNRLRSKSVSSDLAI